MKKVAKILVLLTVLVTVFAACRKEDDESRMMVKMKDSAGEFEQPGDFQEVNVDVIGVEIHYSSGDDGSGWVSLRTNKGIYNLLELQNNLFAVLAQPTDVPAGKVDQMRLKLGSDNTIKVDGVVHALSTPSAQQSGLKFNLNSTLAADVTYEVLIDFDSQKSIVLDGSGSYSLKPVIKVESITAL